MAVYNATTLTVTQGGDTYTFTPAVQMVYYGTCSTGATEQTKEITSSISSLVSGLVLVVKFDNAQTYNGKPILKIGSLGSITVYNGYRYMWNAGAAVAFAYDGTRFYAANIGTATTTYYGLTKLSSSTSSTSTALAATPSAVKAAYDAAVLGMTGATSSAAGAAGRVPAPSAGDQDKVLTGAGTWYTIPTMTGATASAAGAAGYAPAPAKGAQNKVLSGAGTWIALPTMTGATASAAGTAGYVPAPAKGAQDKVLAGSGTWITLPDSETLFIVDMGTVSSLPQTKSVSGITTDMVCVKADIGDPSAQMSEWSVNTNTANSVTLSGDINGSTTVKLYFQKSRTLSGVSAG